MRAAVIGRVEDIGIPRPHCALVGFDDGFNRLAHRAQMDRDVRGIGDQATIRCEDGAREIQPFLDIHRVGGIGQRRAHLLGDRHKEVVKHLQHDRVGPFARAQGRLSANRRPV